MKCLLIDDNPVDLLVHQHILRSVVSDAEVVRQNSGAEALEYLINNRDSLPDFILLDIKMPEMDGFQFLERLKTSWPEGQPRLRVFMLSSSIDPQDMQKARKEKLVLDFIHKPLKAEKVKECLLHYGT